MGYQKFIAVGRLGSDPEARYTQSGQMVTNLSLAVGETWTDKEGERQEKTTWVKVACWGKLAEVVSQHLAKGREVLIEGKVNEPSVWTDREGNARASLEVTAYTVQFLGSKSDYEGVRDAAPTGSQKMNKPNARTAAPQPDPEIPY